MAEDNLVHALHQCEESPWSNWSEGSGLDARSLARLLRPFKISPQNVRIDDHVMKGYEREDFREAWDTYLPANAAATALQTAPVAGINGTGDPLQTPSVAEEESEESPPQTRRVAL